MQTCTLTVAHSLRECEYFCSEGSAKISVCPVLPLVLLLGLRVFIQPAVKKRSQNYDNLSAARKTPIFSLNFPRIVAMTKTMKLLYDTSRIDSELLI